MPYIYIHGFARTNKLGNILYRLPATGSWSQGSPTSNEL